jgi:hypothetical protein
MTLKPQLQSNSVILLCQMTQSTLRSRLKLNKVATCFISTLGASITLKDIVIGRKGQLMWLVSPTIAFFILERHPESTTGLTRYGILSSLMQER